MKARDDPPSGGGILEDPEERRVLYAALDSFRQYRQAAHYNITHLRRQSFYSLPSAHMDILCEPPFSLPATFEAVDDAIDSNAVLSEAILQAGLSSFGISRYDDAWKGKATPNDMDKVRSTIRQFFRDWSAEGEAERQASYSPVIAALHEHLPTVSPSQRHRYTVLVPGAGLGRLVFEICAAGYTVEGNEISYHQLMASNYILNSVHSAGQHDLFPWALNFSNHLNRAAQLQTVAVPDIHPSAVMQSNSHRGQMSMTAGDFCELYREPQYRAAFEVVATCFFIDTAPNVINYFETIRHCLKPGGLWINLGPLLWHFESSPTPAEREKHRRDPGVSIASNTSSIASNSGIGEPGSFELSQDEVLALVQRFGFDVVSSKQAPGGPSGYIQDSRSMLQTVYQPAFWVARYGRAKEEDV